MEPPPPRIPPARTPSPAGAIVAAVLLAAMPLCAHRPAAVAAQSTPADGAARTTFGDALIGLVNTLRAEREVPALPRDPALDRVAADQAAALALGGGVAGDDTPGDGQRLRAAAAAAGWTGPPARTVARAYAVRRSLEQAADWLTSPDNPDGAALFDAAASEIGAAAAALADGRIAWVVVIAAGAPPSVASANGPASLGSADPDAGVDVATVAAPPFAVTALPAAHGAAFGPALPDGGAPGSADPLAAWTPALQGTARIVVAVVVALLALTALRLKGADPN